LRVAIDTGGTFTDCVYLEDGKLQVLKVRSTPADPSHAVLNALAQIGRTSAFEVRHGTTVGTNAMLERKGARVAFVTTAGFEDTIAIGRQTRAQLYDWFAPPPVCLVPRELRFGVPERVSAEGAILRSPTDTELQTLVERVRASRAEAIAISLLFSFANPQTELRVEAALRVLELPISTSLRLLPEFREYERASTTVVNAYLSPKMQDYLLRLESGTSEQHGGSVDVMQSSGGIIPARLAAQEPVRTVLSGPAGGVIGACKVAAWAGFERIIGFDMGGTSTDVFLSDTATGGAQRTRESMVAGVPIGVPMLDIHTAGAGGGSIARFDAGGLLRVGPESAGVDPGPVCFGHGELVTVTDANLVLGRLDGSSFMGGSVALDLERARAKMQEQKGPLVSVEAFAAGILRVVETQMEKAMRVISVERGHHPRDFALVAFGGGGPLHACALARALRIPTVLIPAMPGALSAVGILLADAVRDYARTVMLTESALGAIETEFIALKERAAREFAADGLTALPEYSLDLRYRGQGYELNVPCNPASPAASIAAFHHRHQQLYGFSDAERPVEIVNLRLRMISPGSAYQPIAEPRSVPGPQDSRPKDACSQDACPQDASIDTRPIFFDGKWRQAQIYRRQALQAGNEIAGPALITE